MRSISIPMIIWLPILVWFVTYQLTKAGGLKKWLKKYTDFYMQRRDVDMDKKIKYRITNIDELAKKLKKAQALSEELASVLKEIDEFKAKIRFDE